MRSVWSQVGLALGAVAAIVVAAHVSRPYYVSREPVAEQIVDHKYVDSTTETRPPWMYASAEEALKTPQFLLDRELFTMDLLRTGKVSVARARALADIAVREAYTRRVPPALVLGVMLTENDELKSSARSRVGAVGLMQVYPKPWRSALARKFGTNIHTDSTNLKYGIFILGWVVQKASALVDDRDAAWRKALLGYNGCVRGPQHARLPQLSRRRAPAGRAGRPSRAAAAPTSTVRRSIRCGSRAARPSTTTPSRKRADCSENAKRSRSRSRTSRGS